jgi:hypothetical protein
MAHSRNLFLAAAEFTIEIPAIPRPTIKELQAEEPLIESVELDKSPEGPLTLKLGTVLRWNEKHSIHGAEYERRLVSNLDAALGYQHREWLLKHQHEFPIFMGLLEECYIDFPGIVVIHPALGRRIPYCRRLGLSWSGYWHAFEDRFISFGRVAFSGK